MFTEKKQAVTSHVKMQRLKILYCFTKKYNSDNNGVTGLHNSYPRACNGRFESLARTSIFKDLPLLYSTIGGSFSISLSIGLFGLNTGQAWPDSYDP